MAAAKQKPGASGPINENNAAFEWDQFLPEGFSIEDAKKLGDLTPMYIPELAFSAEAPPVFGLLVGIHVLPTQNVGKTNKEGRSMEWTPRALVIEALKETVGWIGKKDAREQVKIAAGEMVLVPMTGKLDNMPELKIHAVSDRVVPIVARVIGRVDTGQADEMWDWQVYVFNAKSVPRPAKYALPNAPQPQVLNAQGQVISNVVTGKVEQPAPAPAS